MNARTHKHKHRLDSYQSAIRNNDLHLFEFSLFRYSLFGALGVQETVLGEHDGSLGDLSYSRQGNARGLKGSLIVHGGSVSCSSCLNEVSGYCE